MSDSDDNDENPTNTVFTSSSISDLVSGRGTLFCCLSCGIPYSLPNDAYIYQNAEIQEFIRFTHRVRKQVLADFMLCCVCMTCLIRNQSVLCRSASTTGHGAPPCSGTSTWRTTCTGKNFFLSIKDQGFVFDSACRYLHKHIKLSSCSADRVSLSSQEAKKLLKWKDQAAFIQAAAQLISCVQDIVLPRKKDQQQAGDDESSSSDSDKEDQEEDCFFASHPMSMDDAFLNITSPWCHACNINASHTAKNKQALGVKKKISRLKGMIIVILASATTSSSA